MTETDHATEGRKNFPRRSHVTRGANTWWLVSNLRGGMRVDPKRLRKKVGVKEP